MKKASVKNLISSFSPKNIILTGFMGTGKTRVGKELAKRLRWNFVDTDELIEKKAGTKIKKIFEKFGESYFRELESEVAKDIIKLKNYVIATGGGIVLRKENVKNLKKAGILICLKSTPPVILKRIGKTNKRPLLNPKSEDAILQIERILSFREPYYKKADIMINTDNLRVKEVVEKIIKRLRD